MGELRLPASAAIACCVFNSCPAAAAPGDIFAEVMAAPPGTYAPDAPWLTPGHAFVCILYDLNSGIKEECYGFYPKAGTNAAVVGAPNLANEFQKNPDRFAHVSWGLKKKITAGQRQAFFTNVLSVDRSPYSLLLNNCGDFVSSAVDVFGWRNVTKGRLPEPYVRDLVAANIYRFAISAPGKGALTRSGNTWTQHIPGVPDRTYEDEARNDGTHLYIIDRKNNVEERLPLNGGKYQYNYAGHGWQDTGSVTVQFDP